MSTQPPSPSPEPNKDAIGRANAHHLTRDALTGAFNAQYFEDLLRLEAARAQRYEVPLSLLIVSVDNLRWVNDTFGHISGDGVLKAVTRLIEDSTRAADVVCRIGENELAIVLPHTELPQAAQVCEKLKTFIEMFHLPVAKPGKFRHFVLPQELKGVALSMSFGVGQYRSTESPDAFILRVRQTLQRAKNGDDSDEGLLGVPMRV